MPKLCEILSTTEEIKKLFRKYGVTLAYLFGSQARGRTTLLSDVDIAVLFSKEVSPEEYSDKQVELITEFMSILSRNDVDVVVLNAATPLMCYKVIESGRTIFINSEKDRVDFEVSVLRAYLDTKKIREVQTQAYLRRLSLKGLASD